MRRACLFVSAAVMVFAMGCSGGRAPTSPSRAAVESPADLQTVSTSSALFGASAVDFARCLQGAEDPGCFAAARIQRRAIGAAATAPGAPNNLSTSSSGSTVTLTWSAPSSGDPLTTYIIEAGSGPGLANLANFTTNNTATSFSASGIGAGTYYVRIRAQNAGGTSAASNESILVVGSTGCTAAPNVPAGLATTVSGSTVTLTWSAPAGGCASSSYVLQAGSSAGASDLANANVGAGTSYVAIGVGSGTYYVRVRAVNAYGQSAGSNEVVVTVGASPGQNVSGRWVGLAPDGLTFDPRADAWCDSDLQLDLTQVGTALSGTITRRARALNHSGCQIGDVLTTSLTNGTASGTAVSFRLHDASGVFRATFSGAVSGNRMSGVVIGSGDGEQVGTFAATRQ